MNENSLTKEGKMKARLLARKIKSKNR